MKLLKHKKNFIGKASLWMFFFIHSLLTACSHVATYHAIEPQNVAQDRAVTDNSLEAIEEDLNLNVLYARIFESKNNHHDQESDNTHLFIAFKAAADKRKFPLHQAIKSASRETGLRLSSYHVYDGVRSGAYELIAQVICAGVVDIGLVFTKLIEANTTIPCKKSEVFSTATDNQSSVTVHVLQGNRPMSRHNRTLAQFHLTDTCVKLLTANEPRRVLDNICRKVRKDNEKAELVIRALDLMDRITELELTNQAKEDHQALLQQYGSYQAIKHRCTIDSSPDYFLDAIDCKILDILPKLIATTNNTVKARINLLRSMEPNDVALYRHAFEIIDEKSSNTTNVLHPNAYNYNPHAYTTNVLHPDAYQILSEHGYTLAAGPEDLHRIISYLKRSYPTLFNRVQPSIPDFHGEDSQENILLNEKYMKIYYAPTCEKAGVALRCLDTYAKQKGLNFKEVLKKCHEQLNLKLNVKHLSNSIWRRNFDLVQDVIEAGVVDGEATRTCSAKTGKENLRSCLIRHLNDAKQTFILSSNFMCEDNSRTIVKLKVMIDRLDHLSIK